MESPPDPDMLLVAQRLRLNTDRLRKVVRRAGLVDGMSRSQESALSVLGRLGPRSTAELARREQLRPQSMGTIVGDLVAQGFVEKQADPTDGRRELVALTDAGRTALAEVNRIRDADLAALLSTALDVEERTTLSDAIALLERLTIEADPQ